MRHFFDRLEAMNMCVVASTIQPYEYSHRLHYLQMVTEKLSKAFQASPNDTEAPATSHVAFVRFLQTLKGRPDIRQQLGYTDGKVFQSFINSLLDLAHRIQKLAPAAARLTHPNSEYPWLDLRTNQVVAPADYDFPEFTPDSSAMVKLEKLVRDILRIAT
jgi:hypothetical protein